MVATAAKTAAAAMAAIAVTNFYYDSYGARREGGSVATGGGWKIMPDLGGYPGGVHATSPKGDRFFGKYKRGKITWTSYRPAGASSKEAAKIPQPGMVPREIEEAGIKLMRRWTGEGAKKMLPYYPPVWPSEPGD